jgi:DNA invertase Pin-like site-specific DNA recombinase
MVFQAETATEGEGMPRKNSITAVAYYRTSSAGNVGADKDSEKRQRAAVQAYAKAHGYDIIKEYYDAAVSGSDPIDQRDGFRAMLSSMLGNGAQVILIENASRFARDLAVQLTGHDLLKAQGITLLPVDAPDYFTDETPTAVMVRQILGAVSQFEKTSLVQKLRQARARKRLVVGRCEGRPPVPAEAKALAKRLYRNSPKTGKRPSLRAISHALTAHGFQGPSGRPYGAESVKRMVSANI